MSEFEVYLIDSETKGNVLNNSALRNYFINHKICENKKLMQYIARTTKGSIIFSTGHGEKKLMLVAGVHGDELPPQVALLCLMDNLIKDYLTVNCKLFIVPILIPKSTMENTRYYNSKDMNRFAGTSGITKKIVDFAVSNQVDALCDCHSTDPNRKPGFASVFCSIQPLIESSKIARHICMDTKSRILPVNLAGSVIEGAVEDELNLRNVASVTCECVSVVGVIDEESVNESYSQILSFLRYFSVI